MSSPYVSHIACAHMHMPLMQSPILKGEGGRCQVITTCSHATCCVVVHSLTSHLVYIDRLVTNLIKLDLWFILTIHTSSHNLEIETGGFRGIQAEDRMCQLGRIEPETELHHLCSCPVYYEIRGRFHCLFREGFGPLTRAMNYIDQRCLGLFLLELRRHRKSLLRRPNNEGHSQREITDFFRIETRS